jgi:hypothetical protein
MWVEGRIHAASSWPTPVHGDRYGLLMIDPGALDDPEAPAARLSYLGSVEPVADSVDAVQRPADHAFDAIVDVETVWLPKAELLLERPGTVVHRRRARVVTVTISGRAMSAARFEHDPSSVVLLPGQAP